ESVLPPRLRERLTEAALFAPSFHVKARMRSGMEELRRAIREQRKVKFRYVDKAQAGSERVVQPLGLYYWGQSWSLAAWCELRQGFRNFRLDRAERLEVLLERFEQVPGRTLSDFLLQVEAGERGGADVQKAR